MNLREKILSAANAVQERKNSLSPDITQQKAITTGAPSFSPYTPADTSEADARAEFLRSEAQRNRDSWVMDSELGTASGEVRQMGAQAVDLFQNILRGFPGAVQSGKELEANLGIPDEIRPLAIAYARDQERLKEIGTELSKLTALESLVGSVPTRQQQIAELTQEQQTLSNRYSPGELEALQGLTYGFHDTGDEFNRAVARAHSPEIAETFGPKPTRVIGDLAQQAVQAEGKAEGILNYTPATNPIRSDAFTEDLGARNKAIWDDPNRTVSDKLWESVGNYTDAVLANPGGFADMAKSEIADLLPIFAGPMGWTGMAAQSLGSAAKTRLEIQKELEDKGVTLTAQQRETASTGELLHALVNVGGAGVVSKLLTKGSGKVGQKVLDTTAGKVATSGARVVGAGVSESGVGAIQSVIEQTMMEGHTDTSNLDYGKVVTGAQLGGTGGAGVAATVEGARATGVASDKAATALKERRQTNAGVSVDQEAVKSGDLSKVVDPNQKDFQPLRALNTIRARNANKEAGIEEVQQNQDTAQKIMGSLIVQRNRLMDQYDALPVEAKRTPDQQKQAQTLATEIKKATDQLDVADRIMDQINTGNAITGEVLEESIEVLSTATEATPETTAHAMRVINAAMRNPAALGSETLQKILQSVALTPEQKAYLNTFAKAQETIKDVEEMEGVVRTTHDIIEGNAELGWKGIKQYRRELAALNAVGDQAGMQRTLDRLAQFAQGHRQKATDFRAAYAALQTMKTQRGNLTPDQRTELRAAVDHVNQNYVRADKEKTPYNFTAQTPETMVIAVETEATALETLLASGQAQVAMMNQQPVNEPAANTAEPVASPAPEQTSTSTPVTPRRKAPVTPVSESAPNTPDGVVPAAESRAEQLSAEQEYEASLSRSESPAPAAQTPEASTVTPSQETAPSPVTEPTSTENTGSNYIPVNQAQASLNEVSELDAELSAIDAKLRGPQQLSDQEMSALEDRAEVVSDTLFEKLKQTVNNLSDGFSHLSDDAPIRQVISELQADAKEFQVDMSEAFAERINTALDDIRSIEKSNHDLFDKNQSDRATDVNVTEPTTTTNPVAESETGSETPQTPTEAVSTETSEAPTDTTPDNFVSDTLTAIQRDEQPVRDRPNTLFSKLFQGFHERIQKMFVPSSRPTVNPLLSNPNFMQELREYGGEIAQEYLGEMTPEEIAALNAFSEFHTQVYDLLAQQLKPAPAESKDNTKQSYVTRMLRDPQTGELNQNAVAAVSAAIYNWMGTQASGTLYNDDRTINSLIGRDQSAAVPPALRELLVDAGTGSNTLAESLGRQIRQHLQFEGNETTPENALKWVEADLGNVALLVMRDPSIGVLTMGQIDGQEILWSLPLAEMETSPISADQIHVFYRVNSQQVAIEGTDQSAEKPVEAVRMAASMLQGTDQVLSRLFGSDVQFSTPRWGKPTRVTQKMRGTDQKVSEAIQTFLTHAQSRKWEIKDTTSNSLDQMSVEAQLAMFGYNPDRENHTVADRVKSERAKNAAALRSWEHFNQLKQDVQDRLAKGKAGHFYFTYFMARQMRVFMDSGTVNPQANKNHRFLVRQKSWQQEVTLSNQDQVDTFKLALAEAFNLKRDKKENEVTLAAVDAEIQSKAFQQAVKAITRLNSGREIAPEMKAVYEKAVTDYVAAKETGIHAFDGLVQYSIFKAAQESGQETVTLDLMPEIDGITNGPIIGLIQFAGAENAEKLMAALNKGGIYFDGQQDFATWKKDGKRDAYEETSHELKEALHAALATLENPKTKAHLRIAMRYFGTDIVMDKDGNVEVHRNMGKNPTMITVYGSGKQAVQADVVEVFLEGVRDALQEAYDQQDLVKANQVINEFNTLSNKRILKPVNSLADILAIRVRPNFALDHLVGEHIGAEMVYAVNQNYQTFKNNRAAFNQMIQAANVAFTKVYEKRYAERQAELVADGTLREGELLPLPVAKELQAELREIMPIIHTPFSKETDNLEEGLWLGKRSSERMYQGGTVGTGFVKKQQIKAHKNLANSAGFGQNTINTTISRSVFGAKLGVGAAILSIHMNDAIVALSQLSKADVLSVFDGFGYAMGKEKDGAKQLNQAFHTLMDQYSIFEEGLNTLLRTETLMKDLYNTDRPLYRAIVKEMVNQKVLAQHGGSFFNLMDASRKKLQEIQEIKQAITQAKGNWNQYYLQGASHAANGGVTQAPVDSVEQVIEADLVALSEVEAVAVVDGTPTETPTNPWGEVIGTNPDHKHAVGKPVKTVVDAFQDTQELTGKAVTQLLLDRLKGETSTRARILKAILSRVAAMRSLDKVNVRLIHPDTDAAEVELNGGNNQSVDLLQGEVYAISVSREDGNTIFLKSNAFENHGMALETIAHELIHSVTSAYLTQAKNITPSARQLNRLLEVVKARMAADPDLAQNTSLQFATENTRELVAWSLTNQSVQDVLKGITLTPEERKGIKGRFQNVFQAMVDTIREIVMPGVTHKEVNNAFALLVEATSEVMAQTEKRNSTAPSQDAQRVPPRDQASDTVSRMSAVEIFDALLSRQTQQNPEHDQHLRDLVKALHDNIPTDEILARNQNQGVYDNVDAFLNASVNDRIPFVSSVQAAGFNLSDHQSFVLEQIQVATEVGIEADSRSWKELDRLWRIAAKHVTPGMLNDASGDPAVGQMRYDWIFNPTRTVDMVYQDEIAMKGTRRKVRSDYLARFMAASQVFQPLREALETAQTAEQLADETTLSHKLKMILNGIMDLFRGWMGIDFAKQDVAGRTQQLIEKLADVRVRHQDTVLRSMMDITDTGIRKADAAIRYGVGKVNEAARSNAILRSSISPVRKAGAVVASVTGGQVDETFQWLKKAAAPFRQGKEGIVASIMTEMRGQTGDNRRIHNLLRYAKNMVDKGRREMKSTTARFVRDGFVDQGKHLTPEIRQTLTQVLVETDLELLLDTHSIQDIQAMVLEDSALVTTLQNTLQQARVRLGNAAVTELDAEARYLGYFIATGINKHGGNLKLNAELIVMNSPTLSGLTGTKRTEAIQYADQIASLYALHSTPLEVRQRLQDTFRDEQNRTDGGQGIENLLRLHRHLKAEAKEKNFSGNGVQMLKGYTRDTFDPNRNFEVMNEHLTPEEEKYLALRGYTLSHYLDADPTDPHGSRQAVYISTTDGLSSWLASTVSLTTEGRKGSRGQKRTQRELQQMKQAKARHQLNQTDPASVTETYMVPVYDDVGNVVDYRYMMSKANRNNLLKRNTLVDEVLGGMAANTLDKVESREINNRTVNALFEQYQEDVAEGRDEFVMVGPNSPDPSLREIHTLMPQAMKDEIRRVWGSQDMMVRRDLVDLTFGYRKFAITNLWEGDPATRSETRKLLIATLEMVLGSKAISRINFAGNIWQELIREVKDIWVIKNLVTLLGNQMSNTTVLFASGLSPIKAVTYQVEGFNLINEYQKDNKVLGQLRYSLALESAKPVPDAAKINQLDGQIARLEDKMSRNKISELVDAGVFQTIIEDIDTEHDEFSYRQKITDSLDAYTSAIPGGVKKVASEIFMTRKSTLYRSLAHLTQVSDLTGRYALYRHMTERKNNPLSRQEAIEKSVRWFVNYDIPTHKFIQWANDNGLLWFTKYYIRVQAVIWDMFKEQPARMLMLGVTQNMLDFWNIYDSILTPGKLLRRYNNPVMAIMTAPSDLVTFQAAEMMMGQE